MSAEQKILRVDQTQSRLDRINLAIDQSRYVIAAFESIGNYLRRKGFAF